MHVGVVGDSLVHTAEHGLDLAGLGVDPDRHLTDELVRAGYSASVTSQVGATTAGLATVSWVLEPDIVVVALGSNDLYHGATPVDEALANVDTFTGRYPDACVVLVEVAETAPWELDVYAPPYNAALAEHADVVVAWSTVAPLHVKDEDGVHFADESGAAAYRSLIVDGVTACAQRLSPPP